MALWLGETVEQADTVELRRVTNGQRPAEATGGMIETFGSQRKWLEVEKIHITSMQAIKSNEAESAAVFCHPAGSGISVGRGHVVGKNGLIVPEPCQWLLSDGNTPRHTQRGLYTDERACYL